MKTLNALINVCSLCPIQLLTILIVAIGYVNKPIAKIYSEKVLAFVKGIWLPTGSNYLLFSGESPGKWCFHRQKMEVLNTIHFAGTVNLRQSTT